jgi:putative intracellular protease/amidase
MAETEAPEEKQDEEFDEDGLKVQKYRSMVLIVVPEHDYGEEALRYARSNLFNVHVGSRMVSTQDQELIKGRFQDEFIPDGLLSAERMDDYSGVVFVGGEGALELANNPDALRLAREAAEGDKLIGAWAQSVAILANAGVVKGKKVTGSPDVREAVQRAGGKFTGRQLEVCGKLVTAGDSAVGMRFGRALAEIVRI